MSSEPMTPAEFDAACRDLVARCPFLSETSGRRSAARNAAVGGHKLSKHVVGMARDFVAESQELMEEAAAVARSLGFWVKVHDVGSGDHVHVQGIAPGEIPGWWSAKYG